jgi:hypothetical protein
MRKLVCTALLAGSLAGCAYPKTAMVEVAGAPPPAPHPVAPPPAATRAGDDDEHDVIEDFIGALFDVLADSLSTWSAHHR